MSTTVKDKLEQVLTTIYNVSDDLSSAEYDGFILYVAKILETHVERHINETLDAASTFAEEMERQRKKLLGDDE